MTVTDDAQLQKLASDVAHIKDAVNRIQSVVIGNGSGGLVTRLALNEQGRADNRAEIQCLKLELEAEKSARKEKDDKYDALVNKLIGAGVALSLGSGSVGALMVNLFK